MAGTDPELPDPGNPRTDLIPPQSAHLKVSGPDPTSGGSTLGVESP